MNPREQGFLLLTGLIGDSQRKPLTIPQLRNLAMLARNMERPLQDRDLTAKDLAAIGCSEELACRVLRLLAERELLELYIQDAEKCNCLPITRISQTYPHRLRRSLGLDAPGSLWLKGDYTLLGQKTVSVVGSRDLEKKNLLFARELGKQAALQGYTLVSGNARGADREAQDSCLAHGGSVISVVADELKSHPTGERILYVSEGGFDLPFSAYRALQRNRIIHGFSEKTFVVQCGFEKGGTWDGTWDNLRHGWSQVIYFDDGSMACKELESRGAEAVTIERLGDFSSIQPRDLRFMD